MHTLRPLRPSCEKILIFVCFVVPASAGPVQSHEARDESAAQFQIFNNFRRWAETTSLIRWG